MSEALSDNLLAYLRSWFTTSTKRKADQGNTVTLTFEDFLGLFRKSHLVSLQNAIDANRLRYMQGRENPYALVVTWISYAACSLGIFGKDTATICSRAKSARINLPQAGDKLRAGHKARISAKMKGIQKSEDHKKAISEGCKGVPKQGWSPERKAARSAQIAARRAGAA